uniref:Uncharacterized protein n=1 Tax=Acrobeloides nanus TaxID=290746 RepID=A0A914DCA2_9BILA
MTLLLDLSYAVCNAYTADELVFALKDEYLK